MESSETGVRVGRGLFVWVLFIALAIMLFMLLNKGRSQHATISLGEFNRLLKDDRVAYVDVGKDNLYGEFKRAETIRNQAIEKFHVPLPEGTTSSWQFTNWLLNNAGDAGVGVQREQNVAAEILVPLIPWLLIFLVIWFFVFRQFRKRANAQIGAPLKVFVVNQPDEQPPLRPSS
jgi:ATP-dependent Zn protease